MLTGEGKGCAGSAGYGVSGRVRGLLLGIGLLCSLWALASSLGLNREFFEKVASKYGPEARLRVEAWNDLIQQSKGLGEMDKLKAVNRFFNEMNFVSDLIHWGEDDYWATPVEFLGTDGGDCEDFSIAKYFTLRELDVPDERMRLMYVKALKLNQAHMVLTYVKTPDAEPLILDNLNGEILKASLRQDLLPVYSFNGDGLWLAKERGRGHLVGKASRLGTWMDLNNRMKTAVNIP